MADARDIIRQYLADLGLDSETDWAIEQIIAGRSAEAVKLDLENRDAFAARFPTYKQLAREGRAISVNEWIAYEKTAAQLFHAAGLDARALSSPEKVGQYLVNDVSVAELQQRVQRAESAVYDEYDVEGARLYGLTPADFVSLAIDPEGQWPAVERKFQAAQAARLARQSGYGEIDRSVAEIAGDSGAEPTSIQQGFTNLAAQREIFNPLDQGEEAIDAQTQARAAFQGDAGAQARIERQARRRVAQFQQGGGFMRSERGVSGL